MSGETGSDRKVFFKCYDIAKETPFSEKVKELNEYFGMKFTQKKAELLLFFPKHKKQNSVYQECVVVLTKSSFSDSQVDSQGVVRGAGIRGVSERDRCQGLKGARATRSVPGE